MQEFYRDDSGLNTFKLFFNDGFDGMYGYNVAKYITESDSWDVLPDVPRDRGGCDDYLKSQGATTLYQTTY